MKYLFLDDLRKPEEVTWMNTSIYQEFDWEIVRSFDEFVSYILKNEIPEIISFDNDLGLNKEGMIVPNGLPIIVSTTISL